MKPTHAPDWRESAACAGVDTEMFYAHEEANNPGKRDRLARHAIALCHTCTVRVDCLDAALNEPGKQHGIRGGTYAKARTRMVLIGEPAA